MLFPPTKPILAIALGFLLVACSDGGSEPDQPITSSGSPGSVEATLENVTLVPGQALTPIPGVVVDLETARRYEAEGDIEAAAIAHIAIAASQSPESIDATLAASRLLIDMDDYEDARVLLEPLVSSQAGSPEGLTGTYLLGRAYGGLERWPEALEQFDAYIAANGPASPYVYLSRNEALLALDRPLEAAESARTGLELGVPPFMTRTFVLAEAQSLERAGAFADAIAAYERFIDIGFYDFDVSLGLQGIAELKEITGDPTFTAERDRLLVEYPASTEAQAALEEAEIAGESINPTVHGLILYRQNEYSLAEPYFLEQIEASPEATETAVAHYYLGAIVESRQEFDDALEHYARVDTLNPGSALADDALWWRASILGQEGDLEAAGALYGRLVEEYPVSSFAGDAAFRHGLLPFRASLYPEAAQIWANDVAEVSDFAARQRLLLWQAKALLLAGATSEAAAVLESVAEGNETEYFGIRAVGLSEGLHGHYVVEPEENIDLSPSWDWAAAEQWLASWTAQAQASRAWETEPGWMRARELWRTGRETFGDLEIYALMAAQQADAGALYTLSRELLAEGRLEMSGRVADRMLETLGAGIGDGLPRELLSLAYPANFAPLVQRYADAEGISPLLMLSLVRQESFFEPRAESPAGALGLMQILPESARIAAESLGIGAEVPRSQLMHADVNLRLGARFLKTQLERFDGQLAVVLGAYNGGPNAAERWHTSAGDDADLFLETIEFDETRLYVEIVAENYAIYRYLYGGQAEPNLPR